MKQISVCFLVLLVGAARGCNNRYEYEFGQDVGYPIGKYGGSIPSLQPLTEKQIYVPYHFVITYVKVTVNATAPPAVDFIRGANLVTILYSLGQNSKSIYSISVKGVPIATDAMKIL